MNIIPLIENKFLNLKTENCRIFNLTGSSSALLLALESRPFIALEKDEEKAKTLVKDINFYRRLFLPTRPQEKPQISPSPSSPPLKGGAVLLSSPLKGGAVLLSSPLAGEPACPVGRGGGEGALLMNSLSKERVVFLPDGDGAESFGNRAALVYSLKDQDSIITSSENLLSALQNKESIEINSFKLNKSSSVERTGFEKLLISLGYKKAEMVVEKGDYSLRGWILDIFPATSVYPLRIEFFGDEIESIRKFDIETQRSIEDVEEFLIFPVKEPDEVRRIDDIFPDKKYFCLYPVQEKTELPQNTVFLSKFSFGGEVQVAEDESMSGASDFVIVQHPPLNPLLYEPLAPSHRPSREGKLFYSSPLRGEGKGEGELLSNFDAGMGSIKGHGILPEERKQIEDLPGSMQDLLKENRVIIIASSKGQAERLKDIFREKDMIAPVVDVKALPEYRGNISITVGELSSGLFMDGLIILTEREIFGERLSFRPMKKSKVSSLLFSLDDIAPGDFVVHRDHGIGKFSGIVRQTIDETEVELMLIEYDGGRLYIPVQNIKNISKYRSEEGKTPKVDSLGGKAWQRKKERVRKKVHEMAEKLLSLYADRKVVRGFSFSSDTELHKEFDSFFAYEETPDQVKAIQDIKLDMESEKPMDRLLCGDVGYGKTEVAMRAAFKAVYDNRQVAVLVPTTILAEQHYRTFKERFSGFPIKVDFISRFKTRKQIESTLKDVSNGAVDIIIGTHGLLSGKVVFNRPGLLIVDEEHRFGVGQKEKIKELSKSIDVLNLTATPIPRTLHMSLSGIRDISVIETPPEERLSVKSGVTIFNDKLIKDAISNELLRGGQVFFVHNRVKDIYKIASHINGLVPFAEIGVAHGQMPERELEKIMHRFFLGEVNVLVSTAIIGAGLDIPTANTIIVNMADRMGLADLYQLRGRVGRSNVKAYALFLAPDEALMTEEAKKRLQAVQEMSYLGAGFRLALKDLEIRGAGNVFGQEQSGHIHDIGYDLYIEMLEKAVAELKGIDIKEEFEPGIDMKISAFIPENYIEDITIRLSFYRRMSSMKTEKAVIEFEEELKDRFGSFPEEVSNLMDVIRLKILARELLILKLIESGGRVKFVFSPDTPVQPDQLFALQKKRKSLIRLFPDGFELNLKGLQWKMIFEEVYKVMEELKKSADVGN